MTKRPRKSNGSKTTQEKSKYCNTMESNMAKKNLPGMVNSQFMNQPVVGQAMNGQCSGQTYTMSPQFIQPGNCFLGSSPQNLGQIQMQKSSSNPQHFVNSKKFSEYRPILAHSTKA